jgi:competence protein ComEC
MRVPVLLAAGPLLAGAALGVQAADSIPSHLVLGSAAAAALALIAGCGFLADRLDRWVIACVLGGSALSGFAMGTSRMHALHSPTILTWFSTTGGDDPVELVGVLRDDGAVTGFGAVLVADAERLTDAGGASSVSGGVRIAVAGVVLPSHLDRWRAGRRVRMSIILREPASFHDPGVPDEARSLARRGIVLLGTVKSPALIEVIERANPLQELASEVRSRIRRIIQLRVGAVDRKSAAIALSILIGDRSGLSDEDERRLQDAGTYHVIAISGGNIAILTAMLILIGRLVRFPSRAAALGIIVILLFYAELAGGSPSVARAVAAAIVVLLARIADHRGAVLNTVAVAALLGIGADPVAVVDAGFLLSFGATAGIVIGAQRLTVNSAAGSGVSGRLRRAVTATFTATVCADLAIAPIAASFFGRLTAAGLLANFAAIPLMTIVQATSTALPLLDALDDRLMRAAGRVVVFSATGLLESSRLVELAPWLARDVPAPAPWFCAVYYACCLAAAARGTRTRTALIGVAVICLTLGPPATTVGTVPNPQPRVLRVVVLDVGQGDATLAMLPDGSAILVDAGGLAGTSFDIGTHVVIPALRALRVDRLHALVITHADPDHIGGAEPIMRRFRPANVWEGVPVPPHAGLKSLDHVATDHAIVWRTLRPGDVERAGSVEIRVLHPPLPEWERQRVRNDDSVVLELRYHDVSIVLPGDIGRETEVQLIPQLHLAPLVVLKAAHHGSATSSSEEFLDATKPAAVIFSAGKNNRFGHPAKAVVERLEKRGAEMFNTAHDGAVFVETDGKHVEVWGWRNTRTKVTIRAAAQHDGTTTRRHDVR